MPKLALVVPSLHKGGGVRAVAKFLHDIAISTGDWHVKPVSLCMASDDAESTSLRRPRTLLHGPRVGIKEWLGYQVPHVGAYVGELEFQRYRPRDALTQLVVDCDLIQVVCGAPAWANAVIGLGKPVALQVATLARVERSRRNDIERGAAATWRRAMTRITDHLDERALRAVDAIQVENPWMLEHARVANNGRTGVDIRYAPPGVDLDAFFPDPSRDPCRGHILCVGRLSDPRKNVQLLLEAYGLLSAETRMRHQLVLAGADGPPPSFWRRAKELGLLHHVQFIHRPDHEALRGLYQSAAAFVLPSDEEGLGVVILEAMACGIPVVSTTSGGPDGILTNGTDGYLVPKDSAQNIAAILTALLRDTDLNRRIGRAALATAQQRYSLQVTGKAFVEVWCALLSSSRGALRS